MTSSQHGRNRRASERVARALAIQFRLKSSGRQQENDETWRLSLTTDMSALGIAFESPVPFSPGDILEMHVVMSSVLDVVKGEGRVVRVEETIPAKVYRVAVELQQP